MPHPDTPHKQQARRLIDQLPDTATLADIADALLLIEDIEAGLAESEASEGADTATLRKRYGLPE